MSNPARVVDGISIASDQAGARKNLPNTKKGNATEKKQHERNIEMNKNKLGIFGFAWALTLPLILTQGLGAMTIANSSPISIPASGTAGIANPYPSIILVSGLTGAITDVNVTINGLSHTFPDDIDILLLGPGGQTVLVMSDAGGPIDVANITLTFDDSAASQLSNGPTLSSGTFMPSNFTGNGGPNDIFPGPAPAGPYGSLLSVFNGTTPNGTWSLFVLDDEGSDVGRIANGWSLDIITAIPEPPTLLLLGGGFIGLAAGIRKNHR